MNGFCIDCGFRPEAFEGLNACPECGSRSVPCNDVHQVRPAVNWQELRVLVMWAEKWALEQEKKYGGEYAKTVYAIARRIENQYPDFAHQAPLSFLGELRQLKQHYPEMTIHHSDGERDYEQEHKIEEFRNVLEEDDGA